MEVFFLPFLSFHLFNLNEALWMRGKISFKKRVDVQLPWIELLSDCDMDNWEPTLTCTFDCFIAFQIVALCPNVLYFSQIQKNKNPITEISYEHQLCNC